MIKNTNYDVYDILECSIIIVSYIQITRNIVYKYFSILRNDGSSILFAFLNS